MVYYFTSTAAVDHPVVIYVGKDKFESRSSPPHPPPAPTRPSLSPGPDLRPRSLSR